MDDAVTRGSIGHARHCRGNLGRNGATHPKKGEIKPWLHKQWCAEYVCRMEDVLHLYAAPHDPARPTVCFDELPYQLVSDSRPPLPRQPGVPVRDDYEYVRQGTCNLFGCFEPHAGRRQIVVTERRTKGDFAAMMRRLADEWYPEAECIRVVLDNLHTHTGAAGALWAGTKPSPRPKHDESLSGWSSTTRRSMAAGSIRWRSSGQY